VDGEGRRAALSAMLDDAEDKLQRISDLVGKAYLAHAEPALTEVMASRWGEQA
jgi:hypothetical protein